ncbi:DUF7133 domain-containing protein [Membranihabitans maritimus]|uniref:DUF7133 domain-containing protein n=1 Tax=Membranihabitans maritimus TaxID=2904244 RepID=UPI001F00CF22|nr:c-type cytochrome [Membranihabitans maritimus]
MKGWCLFITMIIILSCSNNSENKKDIGRLAANEKVAEYLRAFEGRGALTDDSKPTDPEESVKKFIHPEDIEVDLVLSEPDIHQPVEMKFDSRGRLWVVQYNQYPYPEGLKVVDIDNHLRLKFDKIPLPPPGGVKGADKITVFEDLDGNGTFEKSRDVITGLNITTSVLWGRGKVWVLSPPYLLAYPDADSDGIPDGDPEVKLEGFGLEDTHAVANSLRWGPDGWIYGAQGSTTTANISSSVSKDIYFSGQAIWRYHPESEIFEIYAEGGGNTFNVEIDSKGKVFSGQNGYGRGPYYKQGCYYKKSWGKHGPLTNPYAFGYLPDMELEGERLRFTHALVRYEGGQLPERYQNQFIALNPLQSEVVLSKVERDGSSLKNIDVGKVIQTDDHWFRPINILTGPDGGVYITDWYDSRLSHVDARDTWSKSTGRIYRIRDKSANIEKSVLGKNLSLYTSYELIQLFYKANKWYRFMALQELADRQDESVLPVLEERLDSDTSRIALECLWAINLLGGFTDEIALKGLKHSDSFVREWSVRLIGDRKEATDIVSEELIALAEKESEISVRSQLAASAKRLPAKVGLPVIQSLLIYHNDMEDPDIPLMIWWALEAKAESGRSEVLEFFKNNEVWKRPIVREILLKRIVQRYSLAGGEENYKSCLTLIKSAPDNSYSPLLMEGLEEGLRGIKTNEIPEELSNLLSNYRKSKGEPELAGGLRNKDTTILHKVSEIINDSDHSHSERITYIRILGEVEFEEAVPVLLNVVKNVSNPAAAKQLAIQSLKRYSDPGIGKVLVAQYPNHLRADNNLRMETIDLLASRSVWAHQLLDEIENSRVVHKEDIPLDVVNRMKYLEDDNLSNRIFDIWPNAKSSTADELAERIKKVQKVLKEGEAGNIERGKTLFMTVCGTCHSLFGEGGSIGPDLTGYDRRNAGYFIANTIDPNADIREGYVTYTLKTNTGQLVVGRIVDQSGKMVTIQPLGGEKQTFSDAQIEHLEPMKSSLMPEGLLDGFKDQEVRDIFAYIQKTSAN